MSVTAAMAEPRSEERRWARYQHLVAQRAVDSILPVGGTLVVAGLLEVLVRINVIPQQYFPAPSAIVSSLVAQLQTAAMWQAILATAEAAGLGLLVGSVAAVILGLIFGSSRIAWRAVRVPAEFFRSVPAVAIIPVVIVVWGLGLTGQVVLVAFTIFWRQFIQTMYGVADVEPAAVETARAFGLGRLERMWRITIPSVLPYITTSVRISASVAILVAVSAEILSGGGGSGLGLQIVVLQENGFTTEMFAYIAATGLLGWGTAIVLRALDARLLHWHPYYRGTSRPFPKIPTSRLSRALRTVLPRRSVASMHSDRRAERRGRRSRIAGLATHARQSVTARWLASPRTRRVAWAVWDVALPVALVAAWWLVSERANSFYFPPLRQILHSFQQEFLFARFTSDVVPTIVLLLVGFGGAEIVAIVLGILIGSSRTLWRATNPMIQFMRAMPAVALLPMFIIFLGVGNLEKIATIAVGCMWSTVLNTIDGVRAIDPTVNDTAHAYGIRGFEYIRRIVFPAALPRIVAGSRSSLTFGLIIVIVAQLLASTQGIGYVIANAQAEFDIPLMWACVIMLGLLGYLLNLAFDLVQHRVLAWHEASRRGLLSAR